MKYLALFFTFFIPFQFPKAEYRAFLLKITQPPDPNAANQPPAENVQPPFRLVKSNLDHLQYPMYYPLQPGETIEYIDTWMCPGRTGGMTPICESPESKKKAAFLPPE